jgi:uncharacterized protein YndB with AHSA1/START domain
VKTTIPAPIRSVVTAPLPLERAFALFARQFGTWWPREYTWSGDTLVDIGVEPRVGGRCFEIGPDQFRVDWGRVLAWEPPKRLLLAWQISPRREPQPDPAKGSEVEVRFEEAGQSHTRVTLEHRRFERHGGDEAAYRDALASAKGWPWILQRYVEAAGG